MRYFFWLLFLVLMFYLMGCAFMEELLIETQEIAATGEINPEIRATLTIIDDFVNDPWRWFAALAVGYGSALLRRWYKKKKGAKST